MLLPSRIARSGAMMVRYRIVNFLGGFYFICFGISCRVRPNIDVIHDCVKYFV